MQLKGLTEFLQKMIWLTGLGITVREVLRVEISKNCKVSKKYKNSVFSGVNILLMVAQNSIIHNIF